MRRLYVGGLSHTITQKDLKDRFGKFGDVEDVELRTRKDDDGVPYKTFAYVNINVSDADFKKCMTVLNKSKWKGGTLQIEPAKESYLLRLAQERTEAKEQCVQQPSAEDQRQRLLDSLSRVGVDNFTMKSAVPGTEIPGHKDWVVSKFGRVLPIVQLRCQKGKKARTLKYDPSKYSHNIRRLDAATSGQLTPVTQLTWEVQGGDDEISKKRRGEFPPYVPPTPKKSRTEVVKSHEAVERSVNSVDNTKTHHLTNGFKPAADHRPAQRRRTQFTDSDVDSDEEIRRLVASQPTSRDAPCQDVQEDDVEVVGHEYLVNSGSSHQRQKGDEDDYDSADTDELFASRKTPLPSQENLTQHTGNETERNMKRKRKAHEEEEEDCDSANARKRLSSKKPSAAQLRNSAGLKKQGNSSKNQHMNVTRSTPSSSESDDDDEELDSTDAESDSHYEAMFSNVTHLEISLADLQKLAEESQQASTTTTPSSLSNAPSLDPKLMSDRRPAPKKGTSPEEILACIMENESSEDESMKENTRRKGRMATSLPAFQGTRALDEGMKTEECRRGAEEEMAKENVGNKLDSVAPQLNHRATDKTSRVLRKQEDKEQKKEEKKNMGGRKPLKAAETVSTSSCDEEEETTKAATESSSSSSAEENKDEQGRASVKPPSPASDPSSSTEEDENEEVEEEREVPGRRRVPLGTKEEEERQRKANMRRLAAVQQRQKEAEEHKKLIQGALANLDAPTTRAGNHIVFGSDDDDDDKDEQQPTTKKTLLQDSQSEDEDAASNKNGPIKEKVQLKPVCHQLFASDEEDGDEEQDNSRFDIRPEFEGRSGQKLMELQSRFGTDERFRMDSRFLEKDEDMEEESEKTKGKTEDDQDLEEEKKNSLSILQSILGSSQQPSNNKTATKTFRDVSALHYDPSREEHSAFEAKAEQTKESKSARRKKREEAQKLPEVSREIYYDVSGDLQAMFGLTKYDEVVEEAKTSWDQEEEKNGGEKDDEQAPLSSLLCSDPSADREDSSGFKFSFFGDNAETGSGETAEYKVESIQAPKVSWQQDPRLQDSSSEEDEEEQEEDEEPTGTTLTTAEAETTTNKDLFFFFPDDSRLTEGPRLFCCPSQLEEQREQWEERRSALRQEYRKKHKDARRKLRSTQRS